MIKASVEYINNQLELLNYFEKSFEICEIITANDKTFPAEYKSKGEYTQINNFDKYNGVSYIRKRGSVSISEADDSLRSCGDLVNVSLPLKLIAIVPRKKLECDDKYSEDVIASTIMQALITKSSVLKAAIAARIAKINIDSYNTDGANVLGEEYSGITPKDFNYKFAYLSIDLSVIATITKDCLVKDCEDTYA